MKLVEIEGERRQLGGSGDTSAMRQRPRKAQNMRKIMEGNEVGEANGGR